jgi:hypothetical protein
MRKRRPVDTPSDTAASGFQVMMYALNKKVYVIIHKPILNMLHRILKKKIIIKEFGEPLYMLCELSHGM